MNLLQSSFPLDPEPFALVAAEAELELDEVLARTQRLLDERIIREITPIFDTRALGYESMLVAAKVDAENPQRAAKIINSHPGVSHNYLRTHDFNLWFTIATPPDSELGLEGTLEVLQARDRRRVDAPAADPDPVQDQHEPGDGEGHRRARRRGRGGAAARARAPSPTTTRDIAVIRALQGPMEVDRAPLRRGRRRGRDDAPTSFLDHLRGMVDRKLLRRVAAILYHRRAGFSANGMGVWKVPEERDPGDRRPDGLRPRHLPLLPAARPTRTGPTASSRWPTAARRRSATRSSTRSPTMHDLHGDDRATLYSSTEYKKIRLHYFTDDYAALGGRALLVSRALGGALPARARGDARRGQLARCGRCGRSAATRSSSSAARAASWSTSTATATSTGSAPGGR